jgi:hypothetical protein
MKELNDLEKQLRLWTPRRPSKGLEARIFAPEPAPAVAVPPLRLNWLVPATAALLLMCVLFNQRYGNASFTVSGSGPMVAMILSNQSAAAYLPGSFQGDRNTIPADAFEWTNAHAAASSVTPPSRAKLND